MLKLSTKGRYGSRFMLELAGRVGEGPVLLKDIGESQQISSGYLEHIVPSLKTAGLINSSRGAHGGYMLAKSPREISLREIVEAVEGPLTPVECVDAPAVCNRVEDCVTREIWGKLGECIRETLESFTLEDMVKMKMKKRKPKV